MSTELHVIESPSADPSATPTVTSVHWLNLTDKKAFYSTGISGPSDWKRIAFVGEVNHVDLLNKGVQTHAAIDSHLGSTSNPHGVTADQVGRLVNQWNAFQIQSRDVDASAPTTGYVLAWNGTAWAPTNPASGSDVFAKVTVNDTSSGYLNAKINVTGLLTKSIVNPSGNEVLTLDLVNGSIDHTAIQNIGTNSHAAIDSHISTTNSTLALKANITDVLVKTNVTVYTPSADYHPATKKYVDDNAGGQKTLLPVEVIPLVASVYYPLGSLNATAMGALVGVANLCQLQPVIWPENGAATDFSIVVTTILAAANAKIVIYDSDATTGQPTNLLFESGNLSTATTGIKTATANATVFVKGKPYWVGIRFSGATNAVRALPLAGVMTIGGMGTTSVTTQGTVLRRTITFANAAPSPWVFNSAEITQGILPAAIFLRS